MNERSGDNMTAISLINLNKKEQHSHAHRLLRECLKPFGIDYNGSATVVKGKYGKPSLEEHPEVHFNLSHAKGIAACIVSGRECGIDCESVREFRPNVMKRAFTEAERELVMSSAEDERDLMFFRIWTLKEAYIKMIGKGLSFPLNEAEFGFDNGRIVANLEDCTFRQYIIRGSYVVSICEKGV